MTSQKTFFVTGGAGFIGSHLAERLLSEGSQVIVLDNFDNYYDPRLKWANVEILKKVGGSRFTLYQGDIRDRQILDKIFQEHAQISHVVHLAARAGVRPSLEDPPLYMDVNLVGTAQLLEAMRSAQVTKLVFASSSSVYGNNTKVPFAEEDPVDHPVSPYAASKKAGELLCYTYYNLYKFDIFCLRFFTVYGPRQRPEMAISLFAGKILRGEAIDMYGDGSTLRDYTYIDDIIDGLLASIERVNGYEIINLGGSGTVRLDEMILGVESALKRKATIVKKPLQLGEVDRTVADPSRAQKLLGLSPKIKYAEGVRRFAAWFQERRL